VVEVAEKIVDSDGWQQLTMTSLAAKLGVRGPSLYNHVESIEALLAEVQIRALAALSNRLQLASMGKVRADCIRAMAAAQRAYATEHRGLYELAMSQAIDLEGMATASVPAGEALSAAIRSFGLQEVTMELGLSCLAPLHGVITLDRTRLMPEVNTDLVYERVVRAVILMLETEGSASD
jgi:AcrR family transcriptional regulator